LLNVLAKLFLAFNGNVKKSQVAAGFAWGILLGLIPAGNFFFIVLLLVSFFFRHNHSSKIFALAIVKLLSPLIVYPIHSLGWDILHIAALTPFFTKLYNMPFVPFTNFNNTLVMGGLAAGIALWIPFFFIFFGLITLYRNHVSEKIRNSKLLKQIARFPLLSFIDKALKR